MNTSELKHKYLSKPCWQTEGFTTIKMGIIRDVKVTEAGWAEANVQWHAFNENTATRQTWERIQNLSFTPLASLQTFPKTTTKTNNHHPKTSTGIECQGIPDDLLEQENKNNTLNFIHEEQSTATKQNYKKRSEQPHEANRAINYRALLAMIDQRERDDFHTFQLNQTLKRYDCKPVTIKAFKMRTDEFEKSLRRIKDRGCRYRMSEFLTEAFNGEGHWSIDNDSIWRRY